MPGDERPGEAWDAAFPPDVDTDQISDDEYDMRQDLAELLFRQAHPDRPYTADEWMDWLDAHPDE